MTPPCDDPADADRHQRARGWVRRLHDVVLVLLIGLRPLAPGFPILAEAEVLWNLLLGAGWALLALECWAGWRPRLHLAPGGLLASVLLATLLPATLSAPRPLDALAWWGTWAALALFAGYLLQILPGRGRLALAVLAGATTVQILLALGQIGWVFPRMRDALDDPDSAFAPIIARFGRAALAERIARGGAYATLVIANAFAALVVMVTVAVAGAWWRARGWRAWPSLSAAVLAALLLLAALIAAGAKGPLLALALAAALTGAIYAPRPWRWALPGGVLLAVAFAWALGLGSGSLAVRLGYWRAGLDLIAEAPWGGHGLGGFAAHAPRVLPPAAEFSRFAHNALIEATVTGGLGLGLILLLLLTWWLRPVPRADDQDTAHATPAPSPAPPSLVWLLPPALLYAALFGLLMSDNLTWWPGGTHPGLALLWALLLGVVAAAVARWCAALPAPPAESLHLALGVFVLSCLIDFNLHQPALVGAAVVLACLAASRRPRWILAPWPSRLAITAVVAILALAGLRELGRGADLRAAAAAIDQLETHARHHADDPDRAGQALAAAAATLGLGPVPEPVLADQRQRIALRRELHAAIADRLAGWPPARDLRLRLAMLAGDYPALVRATDTMPWHADAWAARAWHELRTGDWTAAVDHQGRAVACAPANLTLRRRLVATLEAAADATRNDDQARTWRAAAEQQRQELTRLRPIVHPGRRGVRD